MILPVIAYHLSASCTSRTLCCIGIELYSKPGSNTPPSTVKAEAAKKAVSILQDLTKAFDKMLLDLGWHINLQRLLPLPKHVEQVHGVGALTTPWVILHHGSPPVHAAQSIET